MKLLDKPRSLKTINKYGNENKRKIKAIRINATKAEPFVKAIEKKQEFKSKVQSGEIKVNTKKGERFV